MSQSCRCPSLHLDRSVESHLAAWKKDRKTAIGDENSLHPPETTHKSNHENRSSDLCDESREFRVAGFQGISGSSFPQKGWRPISPIRIQTDPKDAWWMDTPSNTNSPLRGDQERSLSSPTSGPTPGPGVRLPHTDPAVRLDYQGTPDRSEGPGFSECPAWELLSSLIRSTAPSDRPCPSPPCRVPPHLRGAPALVGGVAASEREERQESTWRTGRTWKKTH